MSYDFYAEKYGHPDVRNWQQYAILKCTKQDDVENYKKSMRYYKERQIEPNWRYIKWFISSDSFQLSNSIFFKICFKLAKPYISKDDEEFWPKDNPVCKDKVFKVPLVRASSWKGALRHALMRVILEKSDEEKVDARLAMLRLFGNEKDSIEEFLDREFSEELRRRYEEKVIEKYGSKEMNLRGKLIFYPTFFSQINLDVIAPHDRKTKTPARGPIYFEVVPEETKGIFSFLYFPFDLIESLYSGNDNEKKRAIEEIKGDWELIREAILAMFTKYGFGAKTTSGYGIAEIEKIEVNGKDCGKDWNKVLEVVKHEYEK